MWDKEKQREYYRRAHEEAKPAYEALMKYYPARNRKFSSPRLRAIICTSTFALTAKQHGDWFISLLPKPSYRTPKASPKSIIASVASLIAM